MSILKLTSTHAPQVIPSILNSHFSERPARVPEADNSSSESGSSSLPEAGETGFFDNRLENKEDIAREGIPGRKEDGEMVVQVRERRPALSR